jgi:hypothetical protein
MHVHLALLGLTDIENARRIFDPYTAVNVEVSVYTCVESSAILENFTSTYTNGYDGWCSVEEAGNDTVSKGFVSVEDVRKLLDAADGACENWCEEESANGGGGKRKKKRRLNDDDYNR